MANTKVLLGFIAGAAIGAIAGILLAPDSGEATRRKILNRAGEWEDEVNDTVDDVEEKSGILKDKIDSGYETWKGNIKSELL